MRRFALAEDAVPQFEVDEQPQPLAVFARAAAVFLSQAANLIVMKIPALAGARTEHELLDHRPVIAA